MAVDTSLNLNSAPAGGAFAITPDDNNDLAIVTRGLYVGTAGNIKVTMANGDAVTITALAAGIVHPLRVKRVWSASLTAGSVMGFY